MSKITSSQPDDKPATRKDVEEIVNSIVHEALGVIGQNFQKVERRLSEVESKVETGFEEVSIDLASLDLGLTRMERKNESTLSHMRLMNEKVELHDNVLRKYRFKTS